MGGDPEQNWPRQTVPLVVDEWLGAADQPDRNRRSNRPADFYRAGFDMAAWAAGGTFHSDCGLQTVPYTDQQRACALAFFMGLSKCDPVQAFDGTLPW